MSTLANNFARNLRAYRDHRRLSQRALSDLTGIAHASISWLENQKQEPSWEQLEALCRALQCDLADLTGESSLTSRMLRDRGVYATEPAVGLRPVLGSVRAGPLDENAGEVTEQFPVRLVDWHRIKCLTRVRGDSMAPTLLEGDYLGLSETTVDALKPHVDIVLAEHDGGNTVKRFGGVLGTPRHVLLTPDNLAHRQLLIPLREFRLVARVAWVHREL